MENSKITRTILLSDSALAQKALLENSINHFIIRNFLNTTAAIRGKEIIFTCDATYCARIEEKILSITSKFDIDPLAVWAYLDKQGFYTPFPQVINNELEKFYIENAKIIDPSYIPFSKSYQIVDEELSSLIEFDLLGGFHIMTKNEEIFPVKRFANYERFNCENFEAYWQWKNEKNEYCDYEEDNSYLIELSYRRWRKNNTIKFLYVASSSGASYRLTFNRMEQKNLKSNFTRSIRRIED